jgi:DNA-binding Lrp family transcriptional regulator
VDSKDFRILVALHENARQSYRSLGKTVSLSAPAVRERLNRLEKRGILQGYWCYPDPSIFGREDLMVFFKGDRQREDALKALATPDVAFVAWKLDGGLTVQAWPNNRSKPVQDLAKALGTEPSGEAFTETTGHGKLTAADWRIIDALIDQPTMPLRDLTKKTGLSPKTVRKHLNLLIRERAIFVMPRLGALADSGDLVYHLSVSGRVGFSELRRMLGDAHLVSEAQEPPMKYLLCRASDLADVTSRTQAVGRLPGVASVTVTLNRELFPATEFVHGLVREKIREWEKGLLSS